MLTLLSGWMMQTTASGNKPSLRHEAVTPFRHRRYLFYFLLAGFDVFAVSVSLYLNHRIMTIYARSVEVNQGWAEILGDTSELEKHAADTNAPGNNVFETRQVDMESDSMYWGKARFDAHLEALKNRVAGETDDAGVVVLHGDLNAARRASEEMVKEAEHLFAAFRNNQLAEAGNRMARMDQRYDDVRRALFQLRTHIGAIQKEVFARQTASARMHQKFEYFIAGLILLMVGGATFFGYVTAKQDEAYAQERERARIRKQAMEVRTRVLKQVMAAQEEERRRIARDLHDEIGQCLTSLLIGLKTVEGASSIGDARIHAAELRRIASMALDEVKRMARGLRPSVLDDVGLSAALERLADDFAHAHDLTFDVKISGLESLRLPEAVETALYRIAQEAITNVVKHAAAQNILLHVEREAGAVHMKVADDGRGFSIHDARTEGGLGLSGMRERVALMDGTISIESQPGQGTRIGVSIPLAEDSSGENSSAYSR